MVGDVIFMTGLKVIKTIPPIFNILDTKKRAWLTTTLIY